MTMSDTSVKDDFVELHNGDVARHTFVVAVTRKQRVELSVEWISGAEVRVHLRDGTTLHYPMPSDESAIVLQHEMLDRLSKAGAR